MPDTKQMTLTGAEWMTAISGWSEDNPELHRKIEAKVGNDRHGNDPIRLILTEEEFWTVRRWERENLEWLAAHPEQC